MAVGLFALRQSCKKCCHASDSCSSISTSLGSKRASALASSLCSAVWLSQLSSVTRICPCAKSSCANPTDICCLAKLIATTVGVCPWVMRLSSVSVPAVKVRTTLRSIILAALAFVLLVFFAMLLAAVSVAAMLSSRLCSGFSSEPYSGFSSSTCSQTTTVCPALISRAI